MSQLAVEKSIQKYLAPILRSEGFSGSGRTYRRITNGFACVVNVQGSQWGGKFAINLGLHPVAVPFGFGTSDLKKIKEFECVLRRRLSSGDGDKWWNYVDQDSLDRAVIDAANMYKAIGSDLFAAQTGPDAPLNTVSSADYACEDVDLSGFGNTKYIRLRTLAILRHLNGNRDEAIAFAKMALADIGSAHGLKRELDSLVDGTWQSI